MLVFGLERRFGGYSWRRRRSGDGRSSSRHGLLPLDNLMRKLACVGQGRGSVESWPRRRWCSWWTGIAVNLAARPPGSRRRRRPGPLGIGRSGNSRSGRWSRRRRRRRRRPHGMTVGRRRRQHGRSRRGGRRGRRRCCCCLSVQPGLLFSEEVDDELLVVLDEVVRQPLVTEIVAVMLSPHGIKGVQEGKLGTASVVVQANRRARVVRKARQVGGCSIRHHGDR